MEIFYFLTKYVPSRLLQNCRMRERVKRFVLFLSHKVIFYRFVIYGRGSGANKVIWPVHYPNRGFMPINIHSKFDEDCVRTVEKKELTAMAYLANFLDKSLAIIQKC